MNKEELTKEVYAHYGLALYLASVLEHSIVNSLVITKLIPTSEKNFTTTENWYQEFDSFYKSGFQDTLGKMISKLKKTISASEELEKNLSTALKRRNYLAHHFFKDRAEEFMNHSGKESMLAFLQESHLIFENAEQMLSSFVLPYKDKIFGSNSAILKKYEDEYLATIKYD